MKSKTSDRRKRTPIHSTPEPRSAMKMKLIASIVRSLLISCLSVVIVVSFGGLLNAGTLTPGASPGATSYTLQNLYNRFTDGTTSTAGNHTLDATTTSPGTSYPSLTDLYNLIPTIDATKVLSGTSYLGVAGTYNVANLAVGTVANGVTFGVASTGTLYGDTDATKVCTTGTYAGSLSFSTSTLGVGNTLCGTVGALLGNMFNGTGQSFTGGSQGSGGVDDGNNASSPPSDRYQTAWTACTAGNSYCGTGLSSADAKDNITGLVWSLPCNGSGCSSFSDSSPLTYTWDSSGANNSSKTASQLCSAGSHGESGWSLPHEKQLMQAYVDGTYGNLEAVGIARKYWSGTTSMTDTTRAIDSNFKFGVGINDLKSGAQNVRCVR